MNPGIHRSFKDRLTRCEALVGTFLNLGSSTSAEISGAAGYDWLLIDQEHGPSDASVLLGQLQAIQQGATAAIVRVAAHDPVYVKRALDLGAAGIMVPYVDSAAQAQEAVAASRYPPEGIRGVSRMNRACGFGRRFGEQFREANLHVVTMVQIETATAVAAADSIAQVPGVDVLFVGPLDLAVNLGVEGGQAPASRLTEARMEVVRCARKAGKAAGILVPNIEAARAALNEGFTGHRQWLGRWRDRSGR